MIVALHLLRSEAARRFGKTIIDVDWRPDDGPIPFMRHYGPALVAVQVAMILATILRELL